VQSFLRGTKLQDRTADPASGAGANLSQEKQAAHLWSVLSEMHTTMNSLARNNPHFALTDMEIEQLNGLLRQVMDLLKESGRADHLQLFDPEERNTASDALLKLAHYKGSLRGFRQTELKESPYSF